MLKLSCQEVQSLLDAFHDNGLDGMNSLAVQEHLDECPDCRRQWRWLCEVEASLARLYESVPSPNQDLGCRVQQPTARQPVPVLAFLRAHGQLAGVVSLALVLAVAGIILLRERTGADIMVFVRDSAKMSQDAASLDLRTSDTQQAEQWLKQRIGFATAVRSPSGFKLVGARSCRINDESVGLLLFERDGQRLAWYVSRSPLTALRGFDDTTAGGIKLGTCEGRQVAAWDAGDVSCLLVTDLTKDALLALANEVAHSASQSLKE